MMIYTVYAWEDKAPSMRMATAVAIVTGVENRGEAIDHARETFPGQFDRNRVSAVGLDVPEDDWNVSLVYHHD